MILFKKKEEKKHSEEKEKERKEKEKEKERKEKEKRSEEKKKRKKEEELTLKVKNYMERFFETENYILFSILTGFAFLALFFLLAFDLDIFYDLTALGFASVQFLAGLGLFVAYGLVGVFLARRLKEKLRGTEKLHLWRLVIIGPAYVIAAIAVYNILKTIIKGPSELLFFAFLPEIIASFLKLIILLGLLAQIYLIPVYKGEMALEKAPTLKEKISGAFKRKGKGMTIWWKKHVTKDYGGIVERDLDALSKYFAKIQTRLAIIMLIPIGIAMIAITPLAALAIVLALRANFSQKDFTQKESYAFMAVIIAFAITSIAVYLIFGDIQDVYPEAYLISYSLGILTGFALFIRQLVLSWD
ncbi:MAG: hypothetical protein Q6356_002220 [Candidatus Wukongarchaeota archaeon]|nr:hypothetical protein [Candidatus Wukongarchaeota archaeon]